MLILLTLPEIFLSFSVSLTVIKLLPLNLPSHVPANCFSATGVLCEPAT